MILPLYNELQREGTLVDRRYNRNVLVPRML
jgi:hypothetical protein